MDNDTVQPFTCPVCGYEAENELELKDHFEERSADAEHEEYNLNPKDSEIVDEDAVGTPAGTPGHPGIDEGTEE